MHTDIDISRFRHLYPFKSHYLDLNGLAYHYLDEGSGKPVVMLHGNPTWSFYFRELITGLSGRYRTIAPDHIGCGLSEKPGTERYDYRLKSRVDDLEALMDHLGLCRDITLVLHDWGGAIGMLYALRHPDRIARLVLMNTAAFFPPKAKKLPLRLRIVRNFQPLATLAVQGLNLFAVAALYMAPRKRLSAAVRAGLLAPYNSWRNRIATLKFVQDIPVCGHDPSYDRIRHLDDNLGRLSHLPMLILWGEHDFVFDGDYLREWQIRFPDAEVHCFPDAGHYVLEDQPQRILKLTTEFLMRHPLSIQD
ncbi:MAG: alpha/beta fold hydrolase [Desulfobacterales bacterium]|nr:alpha/beta fold hydrolase [Desulfobacterales bacterium]